MKNIFILLALSTVFLSCNEENEPLVGPVDQIGSWILVAELNDPGDGSGTFRPTTNVNIITIYGDGTYISENDLCRTSFRRPTTLRGTYNQEKSVLNPPSCGSEVPFQVIDDELTLSFQCIEPCLQKYKRISASPISFD